jgi:hypothetical protein
MAAQNGALLTPLRRLGKSGKAMRLQSFPFACGRARRHLGGSGEGAAALRRGPERDAPTRVLTRLRFAIRQECDRRKSRVGIASGAQRARGRVIPAASRRPSASAWPPAGGLFVGRGSDAGALVVALPGLHGDRRNPRVRTGPAAVFIAGLARPSCCQRNESLDSRLTAGARSLQITCRLLFSAGKSRAEACRFAAAALFFVRSVS